MFLKSFSNPAVVCVTKGAEGAWVSMQGVGTQVAGFRPTQVVDTTGAGDSFFGGFVGYFLQNYGDLRTLTLRQAADCAKFGNAVASLCVEKRGGMPSIPDFAESMVRYQTAGEGMFL